MKLQRIRAGPVLPGHSLNQMNVADQINGSLLALIDKAGAEVAAINQTAESDVLDSLSV